MKFSLSKLSSPAGSPPKVVLLPDAQFFVRVVPISPAATPAEATAEAELAVESLSPFPPAQLYYGFFWATGAGRAVVFAAYRRRFTSEQTAAWGDSHLVVPRFVAALGAEPSPGTTLLLAAPDGFTALRWDGSPVPAAVAFRPAEENASDEARDAIRREVLAVVDAGERVTEIAHPPEPLESGPDQAIAFQAGPFPARLTAPQAALADIRDKEALGALRRAHARSLLVWRSFLGAAAVLALLLIGEAALLGGKFWQQSRVARMDAQRPVVQRIEMAQNLSNRIRELSTKRLLPLEMLSAISAEKPEAITFLRATTNGLNALVVDAESVAPDAVSAFRTTLSANPAVQEVDIRDQRTRENVMAFTLAVTFRPDALKPATEP